MTTQAVEAVNSLRYVKGVGPKRAIALERLGIRSVHDLLYLFPRRYEDRSHFRSIENVTVNETVSLRGEILKVRLIPIRRLRILEVVVGDDTGMIHAVWFNQIYLKKQFNVGQEIILFGKVEFYKNRLQISSPEYELIDKEEETVHTGRITPVYPLTEGLFQRSLRTTLRDVVETQTERVIFEYYPESFREEKRLVPLPEAVKEMHFPTSFEQQEAAQRRIAFDEFLIFEMILVQRMERLKKKHHAPSLTGGKSCADEFEGALSFDLTAGQRRAIQDLTADLSQTIPMNRLLQGDVGSGKTLVATFALVLAAQNKMQSVLLVPTEILAEQHYRNSKDLFEKFSVKSALLTSSTPKANRERLLAELRQGKIQVLMGTHAVLNDNVSFKSLGLVVVDEQHKFGVHQRCQLLNSKPRPHQLVMTATPIPRTLAFTTYGDLAISTIKELPKGRQPIKTYWVTRKKQKNVLHHILEKVKLGEQAYFIFPLIEETEKSDLLAAEKEFETLKEKIFPNIPMGLVHGRMTKDERDQVMKRFRANEVKILVATSVIEVGVDHPNATMMVIENAERFGLAQLHQMRGRIGRGAKASECFLFGEPKSDEGKRRLEVFSKTQDGFVIAEEDLKIRGHGDFLGTRQSGEPYFKVADPIRDDALLREARTVAFHLVKEGVLDVSSQWQGFKNYLNKIALKY